MAVLGLGIDQQHDGDGGGGWGPKSITALISTAGASTVIAFYVVWFLTNRVMADIERLQAGITVHGAQMLTDQREQEVRDANLLFLFRQVCLNTARTEGQREGCRLVRNDGR